MADHYMVDTPTGREVISSFVIRPKRIVDCEIGKLVCGDVVGERGVVTADHVFDRGTWSSSRSLINSLPHPSYTWTGDDKHVQGLLRMLNDADLPTQKGTTVAGLHEHEGQRLWVTPGGTYNEHGRIEDPPMMYVSTKGSTFHSAIELSDATEDEASIAARIVLPLLPRLNAADVILPAIGFFFAAPFAPTIRKILGHFPILFVWGSPGGGKTSTICEVFLPLAGITEARPTSATETEFALVRAMSGSNAIPLFIDEFKSDMGHNKVERLMRLLRRVYGGEVEERGRADQSIRSYHLAAPIVVAGESYPGEDPALRERLLPVNPNPNFLLDNPSARNAFERVLRADLAAIATSFVRFSLTVGDVRERLVVARNGAKNLLGSIGSPDVPPRSFDALTTALFGLDVFERFCAHHGVDVGDLDLQKMASTFCSEVLTGEGRYTKDQFDSFLEALTTMTITGGLTDGKHYALQNGRLLIHLRSCYSAYLEAQKRAGQEDQTAGFAALRRTVIEKCARGSSYVTEAEKRTNLASGRVRCVEIDPDKVPAALDFEHFPGKVRSWGGPRAVGDDDDD